jgi:hypothetical protein
MGDVMVWGGALLLAALAAGGGFALGRSGYFRRRAGAPLAGLAADLISRAASLDLLPGPAGEPLARCLPRRSGPEGLLCELLDSAASSEVRPGRAVTCFFAPVRLAGRKVNAFESEIVAVQSALEPPQIVLRPPHELLAMPRRRHARKRVSDPRFVHVRFWAADAETSRLFFPEATPDIWINAYNGQNGGENAVTNISPGGRWPWRCARPLCRRGWSLAARWCSSVRSFSLRKSSSNRTGTPVWCGASAPRTTRPGASP